MRYCGHDLGQQEEDRDELRPALGDETTLVGRKAR